MRAVGLILAGGNSHKMRELTRRRAVAAMPLAVPLYTLMLIAPFNFPLLFLEGANPHPCPNHAKVPSTPEDTVPPAQGS